MRAPYRIGPIVLTTSVLTVFTAPEGMRLSAIIVTNTTAGSLTVTMSLVPDGVSAATIHRILSGQTVLANDVLQLTLDLPMVVGDAVQASANGTGLIFRGVESRTLAIAY